MTQVSEDEAHKIFEEEIVPRFLVPGRVEQPELTIVGGQQGSGKSSLIKEIVKGYASEPQKINLDDFLKYVPGYTETARADSIGAQHAASATMRRWARWFLDKSLEEGNNIIFEVASGDFKAVEDIKTSAQDAGYKTALAIIARPNFESWYNVVWRYERALSGEGKELPRFVLRDSHDKAYDTWPGTLARQETSDSRFDSILIRDGDDQTRYSWSLGESVKPRATEALMMLRAEPISAERTARVTTGWDHILSSALLAETVPRFWKDFEADEGEALSRAQEQQLIAANDHQAISDWGRRLFEECDNAVGETLLPEFGARMNALKADIRQQIAALEPDLNEGYDYDDGPSI